MSDEKLPVISAPYTPKDIRYTPYTHEEMLKIEGEFGYIEGVVAVELNDIIDKDFEGFLDDLSNKLTGTDILSDISYKVVGYNGNTLYIEVFGDASDILYDDAGELGQEG